MWYIVILSDLFISPSPQKQKRRGVSEKRIDQYDNNYFKELDKSNNRDTDHFLRFGNNNRVAFSGTLQVHSQTDQFGHHLRGIVIESDRKPAVCQFGR